MEPLEELLTAAARGDAARLRALIAEEPARVRAAGAHDKTALHWAAETDQTETARLLIEAGADVEARTAWGASPFDWAATMGSRRVAKLLLERGAGGLNLITAAALGMEEVVRAFLESGDDLSLHARRDAPRAPGEEWPATTAHIAGDVLSDALYAAARNGHEAVASDLLARGASVDAKGFFGASALHWAAINGHRETVVLLIERGADLGGADPRFSSTPEEWAQEGGHDQIADLLRKARLERS